MSGFKKNYTTKYIDSGGSIKQHLKKSQKGLSRVSIQNLPPHVLTWNFYHRFASMWSKISPNDNPRNPFFGSCGGGKKNLKSGFSWKRLNRF